jgi:hypothetical protein
MWKTSETSLESKRDKNTRNIQTLNDFLNPLECTVVGNEERRKKLIFNSQTGVNDFQERSQGSISEKKSQMIGTLLHAKNCRISQEQTWNQVSKIPTNLSWLSRSESLLH